MMSWLSDTMLSFPLTLFLPKEEYENFMSTLPWGLFACCYLPSQTQHWFSFPLLISQDKQVSFPSMFLLSSSSHAFQSLPVVYPATISSHFIFIDPRWMTMRAILLPQQKANEKILGIQLGLFISLTEKQVESSPSSCQETAARNLTQDRPSWRVPRRLLGVAFRGKPDV